MDKRSLLAVALSVAVLAVWQVLFAPRQRPHSVISPQQEVAAGRPEASPATQPPPATPQPEPGPRAAETTSAEAIAAARHEEFIVETDTFSVRFSNEGGRILSWRLLKYVDELKAPIELVPRETATLEEYPFRVSITGDEATTRILDKALYREEVREPKPEDAWPGAGFSGRCVTFSWADGQGLTVLKRLAISSAGYVNHVEVDVSRKGIPVPAELTWAVGLPESPEDTASRYFHIQGQGVAYFGGQPHRYPVKLATAPNVLAGAPGVGALQWGGLESTYFASLIVPEIPETAILTLVPVKDPASPTTASSPTAAFLAARISTKGPTRFMTVVGPKDYDLLSGLGRDLDHVIDFSRFSLIYIVTKWLFLALRWTNGFIGNYGVSIVLLTAIIRAAFFPLTYRSAISMRQNAKKMAKIQPRVKAIQERYRKQKKTMESQRQMNDEVMEVYRKEGLNPMGSLGGCLPLLLQMPVFIAFYNLLAVTIELRGAPFFLWIHDLSKMDPYYISPILMGVSWMGQQFMTSNTIPDPVQRRMMAAMPILFTFMMARMPSGLVIYWLVSNVIGLVQQYLINKKADAAPATAE
jgi:YidC/Oxa1 family membrane protein insertase